MNRKRFLKLAAVIPGLMMNEIPGFSAVARPPEAGTSLPPGVQAIIDRILSKDAGFWNTDWDGTMVIESLLGLDGNAVPGALAFAKDWLDFHIEHDSKLTDEAFYDTFPGPKSRIIRGKYLPFSMYSGFFGLPFPCYEIYKRTGDERAKQICLDVASAILHVSARDQRGLVLHDDGYHPGQKARAFTIPDTMYFVTKALMIASVLDGETGKVYRDQALYQIKTGIPFYLDKEKHIARTVLFPTGTGNTFWCRASGWLSYALVGILRFLPAGHPAFKELAGDLKRLADGVKEYQGPSGGLRVLIDRPETPEETSGTAMCLASVKEAVLNGWIPDEYGEFLERGWRFVKDHVSNEGEITGVYTGWAMTAEEGKMIMDQSRTERGWIPAVILRAAGSMAS